MHLYSKRIAFVISEQSLIPAGGIGQFAKAFVNMAKEHNWIVDFVLDRYWRDDSTAKFIQSFPQENIGRIYAPDIMAVYREHQHIFAFTDAQNFDKEVNFRTAIWKALTENMYDLILCNVPESFFPVYATTMARWTKVLFYTHNENFVGLKDFPRIGPYSQEYDSVYMRALSLPHVYIGTQTSANRRAMIDESLGLGPMHTESRGIYTLPLPFPDEEMLKPYDGETRGILFIGRWEERKDPQAFIDTVAQLQLPVKVLTNATGQAKFVKALKEAGVQDFEVRHTLIGKEKADFIRSAKVMYNPSKKESYGYSTYEALLHMPVMLEAYEWALRIDDKTGIRIVGKNERPPEVLFGLYNNTAMQISIRSARLSPPTPNESIHADWQDFVNRPFMVDGRQTASGNIVKKDDMFYSEHIKSLGRAPSVEDVEPVYRAGYMFKRAYTKEGTFLSKTGKVPQNEAGMGAVDALFA
jgi:glycosyltransferase involved in cell wall biosynthesis